MKKEILNKYANLIVTTGVNVQKGQPVVIKCAVENYEFCRLLVKESYLAGASIVYVDYNDSVNARNHYIYQDIEELTNIPNYVIDKEKYLIEKGICKISIVSSDPTAFAGIDSNKLQATMQAQNEKLDFVRDYTMGNVGQWCVAAAPCKNWALKVFPDLNEEEAIEKLWEAILNASRVTNVGSSWIEHSETLAKNCEKLNSYDFEKLHFKNSLGTDLVVGLADDNYFGGGFEYCLKDNIKFSPNIPSEEIFGMPHKLRVNGVVHSTKPLSYQGNIINSFNLTFKDGKVVDFNAKEGYETLKNLITFDEGSSYLGEVALVPHNSPISNMNILFYNTLFDENASCHLAFGNAYSMNIKNGTKMSKDELKKRGANSSNVHVDFMFGSSDMSIIGTTRDGKTIDVFKNGNFVI